MSQTHEDPTQEQAESEVVETNDVVIEPSTAETPDEAVADPDVDGATDEIAAVDDAVVDDATATEASDDVDAVGHGDASVEVDDDSIDSVDTDVVDTDENAHGDDSDGDDSDGDDADGEDVDGEQDDETEGEGPVGSTRRSRRAPSRDLLEKEGEIAADFLETLLDICDLDGDLDVDIDGDRAAVSIVDSEEGRVPRRLVGTDGKVLDALQELTRLAVYSSTGERSRLILDIAGHRADRRTTLVAQALTAITAVKETGEQQALEPMSAFERKIVHDEVLAAGLRSESDGVEPRRFVVVLPA